MRNVIQKAIATLILGSSAFCANLSHAESVLVTDRGGNSSYVLYWLSENENQLYLPSEPTPQGLFWLRKAAKVKVVVYPNQMDSVHLIFPNWGDITGGDSDATLPAGVADVNPIALTDYLKVEIGQSLLQFLTQLRQKSPGSYFTLEDYRKAGTWATTTKLSLSSFDPVKFDLLVNELVISALHKSKRMKLSIVKKQGETFSADELKPLLDSPFRYKIEGVVADRMDQSVEVPLTDDLSWYTGPANKDVPTYRAYDLLDSRWIEQSIGGGIAKNLNLVPEIAWRPALLDRAYAHYFTNPNPDTAQSCGSMNSRLKTRPGQEAARIQFKKPVMGSIAIDFDSNEFSANM